jgi:uncharacterized membrane protein
MADEDNEELMEELKELMEDDKKFKASKGIIVGGVHEYNNLKDEAAEMREILESLESQIQNQESRLE